MADKFGKTFKKNGKMVRYLYKNGKKAGRKLVPARKKKSRR